MTLLRLIGWSVFLLLAGRPAAGQEGAALKPDLVIGGASAEGLAAFDLVGGLAVAPDGSLFVLDSRAAEIRVFDRLGQPSHRIGGRGKGPGEFQFPGAFLRLGDTLVVVDIGLPRISWVTSEGEVARTLTVEMSSMLHGAATQLLGVVGPWLILESEMGCMVGRPPGSSGTVFADPDVDRRQRVLAVDSESGRVSILKDVVHADIQPLYRDGGCTVISAPFPRVNRFDINSSGELVSMRDGQTSFSTEAIVPSGGWAPSLGQPKVVEFEAGAPPRPVRRIDIEAFESAVLNPPTGALTEPDVAWRREALRSLEYPRELASVDRLKTSIDGSTWTRRGTSPADSTAIWQQLDGSGRTLRSIVLPAALRVQAITADALYGTVVDDYGAQMIHRYPIR